MRGWGEEKNKAQGEDFFFFFKGHKNLEEREDAMERCPTYLLVIGLHSLQDRYATLYNVNVSPAPSTLRHSVSTLARFNIAFGSLSFILLH